MSFAGAYLEKVCLDPGIDRIPPSQNLSLIVAIPAHNEPDLLRTLKSLVNCTLPEGDVEIIIILNSGISSTPETVSQNLISSAEIQSFARINSNPEFRILHANITGIGNKNEGAGFARKIAMDHALSRFSKCMQPDGIIISLDADTLCEKDYLISIENHFRANPGSDACSVYFEHPLEGGDYPEIVYHGILEYELHMRYYIQGLRHSGHPHAFHTVGSAFCIRAKTYAREGGMSKRSAGEDFYFLQKIIPLGKFSELNSTRVIPSPRPSNRVAFGTGPTIGKFISGEIRHLDSYNPMVFYDLRKFLGSVPFLYKENNKALKSRFYSWPESIQANLENEFFERFEEITANSASKNTFTKRFYRWFTMFRTLKYINHAHQEFYPRIPVTDAVKKFLSDTNKEITSEKELSAENMLAHLRKIQKEILWRD